jgi:cell division protein ZapE
VGVGPGRLVDRFPALDAEDLLGRFHPPRRFAGARFENYEPNPDHPSQAAAKAAMAAFAAAPPAPARRRRWFQRADEPDAARPARYLDGGFGVGKTHLLASLWHAVDEPALYLTFEELTAVVGFLGMERAVEAFTEAARVLCIDEFELDDVANTLLAVTFLRGVIAGGVRVAATSNSLPDRLGEGRFNADDFTREIAAIAAHFETLRVDGPDYRHRSGVIAEPLDEAGLAHLADAAGARATLDDLDGLLDHLRRVHPVQFGALLDGLDVVLIRGLHPIGNQGDALLFVQLVDELYDAEITVAVSGCGIDELFPETYRHGGYRKKYGRAESRLSALLAEAATA